MLRLWPIRTKLRIAVSLLSFVLLMLSLSGLWGLYRYKHLAGEIGRQAGELPQAAELNRLAMSVRESYTRRQALISEDGLIDNHIDPIFEFDPMLSINRSEINTFRESVNDFEQPLSRLTTAIENRDKSSLLVDDQQQLELINRINVTVQSIKESKYFEASTLGASRKAEEMQLDRLASDTEHLLAISHSGMAEFSQKVRAEYRTLIVVAWLASITAAAVIATLLLAFRSYVVKPFRTLLDGSRLVADGHFDHTIQLGTGDELSELAMAINGMTSMFQTNFADLDAQVRERTREVIRNEQLASVGFLAAGVAHEINNPLAAIAWNAESLQGRVTDRLMLTDSASTASSDPDPELDAEVAEGLRLIEEEAYRCKGIIEKLLDLSRMSEIRRTTQDLRSIVNDLVAMITKVGKYRCKTIEITGPNQLDAHCNPQEIRQVILNLITNALESVDTNGRVEVKLSQQGSRAMVRVIDNGCGMSREVLDHLFEPFFTRRRDGTGTGLGLSITYRIVSQHGGSLQADSAGDGEGSTMTLMLPIEPENDQIDAARLEKPKAFQPDAYHRAA